MATDSQKDVRNLVNKSYLAKDFVSFRAELLNYARNYFADQMQDFSEASVGGMFMELAAYVGDTMSYYLDYQFNELNPETAIQTDNIESHARNAGVPIVGAAPAVAKVTFYIEVPSAVSSAGVYTPDKNALPIIEATTTLESNTGILFTLSEDLDFGEKDRYGNLKARFQVAQVDNDQNPTFYVLSQEKECISGKINLESTSISDTQVPFRRISLSQSDVGEIISVKDAEGNIYYEVDSLTQDTVYKRVQNLDKDKVVVTDNLEVIPAPFRYIKRTNFRTRQTYIQFGSGDPTAVDEDIIPDINSLALPLYGKRTMSRFSIDPNSLLKTKTLGVSPKNTNISIVYRSGGGLDHNVVADSIRSVNTLNIRFPENPVTSIRNAVILSLDTKNDSPAAGGAQALTLEEVRSLISAARNQQSRIVTQQDLLARLYTLPSTFGRIFRAGIRKNKNNPLTSELYLACQDQEGNITFAPDSLKRNIRLYLNEFRLISDAVEILDPIVINYGVKFSIITTPDSNKVSVINDVISKIQDMTDISLYQIDQPIIEADIINVIINTPGVLSLVALKLYNIQGRQADRRYSSFDFDVEANKFKGLIGGPPGSIFELKYPEEDISGTAE